MVAIDEIGLVEIRTSFMLQHPLAFLRYYRTLERLKDRIQLIADEMPWSDPKTVTQACGDGSVRVGDMIMYNLDSQTPTVDFVLSFHAGDFGTIGTVFGALIDNTVIKVGLNRGWQNLLLQPIAK